MKPLPYINGDTIGEVIFIEEVAAKVTDSGKKYRRAKVQCSCGSYYEAEVYSLKSKKSTKCKECKDRTIGIKNTKHNLSGTRIYTIWTGMLNRCYNETNSSYAWYGAEGKTVCAEWRDSFLAFKEWAMVNGYTDQLEIERLDSTKGYSPTNCTWATRTTQTRNTRCLHTTNTSGFRGVSKVSDTKWYAYIGIDNKTINLGYYGSAIAAAKVRDAYVLEHNLEHTLNWSIK